MRVCTAIDPSMSSAVMSNRPLTSTWLGLLSMEPATSLPAPGVSATAVGGYSGHDELAGSSM